MLDAPTPVRAFGVALEHVSHEEAHETIMKPGLATHSPIDAQWPHSGALSAHFGSGVGAAGLPPGTSPGSSLPPGLGRDFSSRGFSTRGFRSTGGFRSIGGGCSIVLTGLVIVKRDTPKHTAAMAAAAAPASVVVLWDGRFAGFGALPLFLFAQAFASFVIVRVLQCNAHLQPATELGANTARCEEQR